MGVAVWLLAILSLSVVIEASMQTGREDGSLEVRGALHGIKKIFKKHMLPALLIAYKLKALLGLVTTVMSLSALSTASGLAGIFFALFAVAICTAGDHGHRRFARGIEEQYEDPRLLRALEAI